MMLKNGDQARNILPSQPQPWPLGEWQVYPR
jgi:hypothetical protein